MRIVSLLSDYSDSFASDIEKYKIDEIWMQKQWCRYLEIPIAFNRLNPVAL